MKKQKNLSKSNIKKIEKNLLELEESLSKLKNYDDTKYKRIRDVRNLFNQSIDEDYYKPIRNNSAFNSTYIEYESKGDQYKILSIKEYLNITRIYLSDVINDHKTQGEWKVHLGNTIIDYKTQEEWKIQLKMAINFMSSKDSDETLTIHKKSHNIEIMTSSETDDVIKELFVSILQKCQEGLEEKIRGSKFFFDSVDLLHYNLHKVSPNRDGSNIDFLKWLINKKA